MIQTIQLLKKKTFPEKMINYCIPNIRTPTFEILIPTSERLHLLQSDGRRHNYNILTSGQSKL